MSNIWITSDLHWNHSNIVHKLSTWEDKHSCRKFKSLDEHNKTIIKNINKCVKHDDVLYLLGDVSFGGRDEVFNFRKQIACEKIHLILGNHDIHLQKNYSNCRELYTSVQDYLEVKIGRTQFVMCHYPFLSWHKKKNNQQSSIHLYGHTHLELNYHPSAVCACIDVHPEFRPFHIEEIRKIVSDRWSIIDPTTFNFR